MSLLTGRELEFLASLRTSWRRLYLTEVEIFLKEGDTCNDQAGPPFSNPVAIGSRHAGLHNYRTA
jgi:hypothetical protein